jgi:hypothetical protein
MSASHECANNPANADRATTEVIREVTESTRELFATGERVMEIWKTCRHVGNAQWTGEPN